MKRHIILTTILQFFIYLAANAQAPADRKLSSKAMLSDLDMLRSTVITLHPGLGRFDSQDYFLKSLDSVKAAVSTTDSATLMSYFRMINPVLTRLRCGHTKFFPPMKGFPFYFFTDNLIPLIVRFDDRGNLVVTRSSHPEAVGKSVRQINGRPIESILHSLRPQMFVDGRGQSSADAQIQQYFSAWYADFIQEKNGAFSVLLEDEQHTGTTIELAGIDVDAWKKLDENTSFLTWSNHLTFPSDTVARLRISNFYSTRGDKHFRYFLDSAFTAIAKRPIRQLVIDVRGNEGGNDALGKELYAHIAKGDFGYYDYIEVKPKRKKDVPYRTHVYLPRFIGMAQFVVKKDGNGRYVFRRHQNLGMQHPSRNAYTGEVVFLMDGLSYSVTAEFLSVARNQNRGLFMGEESGGSYEGNSSGIFAIYKLPASGLDLGIPLGGYHMDVKPAQQPGRGIMPDRIIKPSRQDLLDTRDPFEATLQAKRINL